MEFIFFFLFVLYGNFLLCTVLYSNRYPSFYFFFFKAYIANINNIRPASILIIYQTVSAYIYEGGSEAERRSFPRVSWESQMVRTRWLFVCFQHSLGPQVLQRKDYQSTWNRGELLFAFEKICAPYANTACKARFFPLFSPCDQAPALGLIESNSLLAFPFPCLLLI